MPQRPSALSLMLCDQVAFEEGTQKAFLSGVFTGVSVDAFPTSPQRFDIFAALTDGLGSVTIVLSAVHMDTDQEIYRQTRTVNFPDPLRVVNLRCRVRQLIYTESGTYLFALTADGEEIAARRVRVYQTGDIP